VTRTIVEAEITFRTQEEVGRKNPLVLNHPTARYRPHVTLNMSRPPEHVPGTERLGVEFPQQCPDLKPEVSTMLRFQPLYEGVDYSGLTPGVQFRILEGPLLVGTGVVRRILDTE
jgi:hypothetical protein